MKKTSRKSIGNWLTRGGAALLAITLAMGLAPGFSRFNAVANESGVGEWPISDYFDIEDEGDSSKIPTSLQPGEVWTGKKVVENNDGTFTVTLYAWGSTFDGKNPLKEGSAFTITDAFGPRFEISESPPTGSPFTISGDSIIWDVPVAQITGTAPLALTYELKLKDGWTTDALYKTGTG
ncbi:MAG: hypothetical protein FWF03_07170, partial [Defluviitaleaceae bacterium]|nr:hypothetical protein [Defluviitaleaceae bacterium]